MTALLVIAVVLAVGITAWVFIEKTMDLKDEEVKEVKETLPVENYEVEKSTVETPKPTKKPSQKKQQFKKKSNKVDGKQ
jgi:uncharacterized protein YoxC